MESPSKSCSKCHQEKPMEQFHKGSASGGRQSWCKKCATKLMLVWRQKNRERSNELSRRSAQKHRVKRNAYHKRFYRANRESQLQNRREYLNVLKAEAYIAYGGYVCACCGETERAFLTLDHINNDGNEHRKIVGRGDLIYRWLKVNGYPPIVQVLCMNCNFGKRMNGGICPHVYRQNLEHVG